MDAANERVLATTVPQVTALVCRTCGVTVRGESTDVAAFRYQAHLTDEHADTWTPDEAAQFTRDLLHNASVRVATRAALTSLVARVTGTSPEAAAMKEIIRRLHSMSVHLFPANEPAAVTHGPVVAALDLNHRGEHALARFMDTLTMAFPGFAALSPAQVRDELHAHHLGIATTVVVAVI